MTTFVLDTLAYAETLKAGGFNEQQAATQARALAEIIDRQMATKAEVEAHENNLRRDIEALRLEMIPDRSVLLVCARRY
ncbi:CCDC90 family protein [Allochromatium vinosum]|uniref:CCDC90 family protein n=1 Tax=Allochromatium vinosum TaxID=1049 RepID=UPI001F5B5C55|nr:CCDC90 family protein [Allochromatium vinosum]